MFFKKKREYNFSYIKKNYLTNLTLLKLYKKFLYLQKLNKIELYFIFQNIIDLNNVFIQRYILFFWLFFGFRGKVQKYKIRLHLGVKYISFKLKVNLIKLKKEEVFIERLVPIVKISKQKLNQNNLVLLIKNLNFLTGLKLYPGIFFVRLLNKLYINLLFKFFNKLYIQLFLSLYKLTNIINEFKKEN